MPSDVTDDILKRIYEENPQHWPHGLCKEQFDGGLFLIRKSASADPVGFVGWQVRSPGDKTVGYYSVGVLPEYRQQGYAKRAVAELLQKKAGTVDEARATIVDTNAPSKALAASLLRDGTPLSVQVKSATAALPPAYHLTPGQRKAVIAAGSLITPIFYDQAMSPETPLTDTLQPWKWDKERALRGGLNTALGALSGAAFATGHPIIGTEAFALAPVKDLVMKGLGTTERLDHLIDDTRRKMNATPPSAFDSVPKPLLYGGGAALAAGALGAAYLLKKQTEAATAQADAARGGRVKVTLPTKSPNDVETVIDLPVEQLEMSDSLMGRLGRDTRRKLYEETKSRTRIRKPRDPNAPTANEAEDLALAKEMEELDKAASQIVKLASFMRTGKWAAAQPTVPSPPTVGENPALRKSQQSMAVQSIPTPPPAQNPELLKAQQASQQAQMDAQNQVAQMEQAKAQEMQQLEASKSQELMQAHQNFSQQLAKADAEKQKVVQEAEVLKMELEKSKLQSELEQTKNKVKDEISKLQSDAESASSGEDKSTVQALHESRLNRISAKLGLGKSANAVTPYNPSPVPYRPSPTPDTQEVNKQTGTMAINPQLNGVDTRTGAPKFSTPDNTWLRADAGSHIDGHRFAPSATVMTSIGTPLEYVSDMMRTSDINNIANPSQPSAMPSWAMMTNPNTGQMMQMLNSAATPLLQRPTTPYA